MALQLVPLAGRVKMAGEVDSAVELRARRAALQLATQLPDDPQEALLVLKHTKTLVQAFLTVSRPV